MSLGSNIKQYREEQKLTQEQVADKLGVTFQAVSSWERDEYKPDTKKLILLAELFDVSVSALVEDKTSAFSTTNTIYNWEHMKTFVKTTAKTLGLKNTLKAIEFASEAHKGQIRKKSDVPYIYHPLNIACHLLAMNITEDDVIAAGLLHDVLEDCGKTAEELPVTDEIKELVVLLSHEKTTEETRDKVMKAHYKAIAGNPKASLIKCVDRCNNLTTMAWGLSRDRIIRMIKETEDYYPKLLKVVKDTPEYNNAAWLLQYQMESMLDIYKRLM
jgi:GTP pyrophosphokinase